MAKIDRVFVGDTFMNTAGNIVTIKEITYSGARVLLTSPTWSSPFVYSHQKLVEYINCNKYKEYKTQFSDNYQILVKDKEIYNLLGKLNKAYGFTFDKVPKIGYWYAIFSTLDKPILVISNKGQGIREIDSRKLKSIINTVNLNKNGKNNQSQKQTYSEEEITDPQGLPRRSGRSREERSRIQIERRKAELTSIEEQNRKEAEQQEKRVQCKVTRRRQLRLL